jgi:hypothetical protein
MCCVVSSLFSTIVFAALFAAPAASEEAKVLPLIHSPWAKFCIIASGTCAYGMNPIIISQRKTCLLGGCHSDFRPASLMIDWYFSISPRTKFEN